jgi:hypothetical protein
MDASSAERLGTFELWQLFSRPERCRVATKEQHLYLQAKESETIYAPKSVADPDIAGYGESKSLVLTRRLSGSSVFLSRSG